jgi:hypothetical protein
MRHNQCARPTTALRLTVIHHIYSQQSHETITYLSDHVTGEYLSRTLDTDLFNDNFMGFTQQTDDQQTNLLMNQPGEQKQENRAHRRSRERAERERMQVADMRQKNAHRRANRQIYTIILELVVRLFAHFGLNIANISAI